MVYYVFGKDDLQKCVEGGIAYEGVKCYGSSGENTNIQLGGKS